MMEKTLVLIKPDAVRRGLVGEVISRLEKKNLVISEMKLMSLSAGMAEKHYGEHKGKPFYPPLIEFITSGPLVALVVSGDKAISIVRKLCGATNSAEAEPGTIRGDLSISNRENIVHSSDSAASAERDKSGAVLLQESLAVRSSAQPECQKTAPAREGR